MSVLLAKQLLMSSSYWTLNKHIVKAFGLETAVVLTVLTEAEQLLADENGWFYQTADTIEDMTGLSRYKQDKAIEQLEVEGILVKAVRGLPSKRYFKLNSKLLSNKIGSILQPDNNNVSKGIDESESLESKVANNLQPMIEETSKLDIEKLRTNKELSNKELNKERSSKEPKEKQPTTTDTRILHRFYQDNFGVESPFIAENIEYWAKDLNTELVLEAMKRASLSNKPFRYAEAIMDKWYKNNIRTLEQVEAEDLQFQRKMQGEPATKTEYSTDWKDMIAELDGGSSY